MLIDEPDSHLRLVVAAAWAVFLDLEEFELQVGIE
jgi:hypothetical protein